MTSLLNQMDVYVLPVFNIDGYDYTHKSVSLCFSSTETLLCCYLEEFVDLSNVCLTCVFYPLGNFRTGCGGKLAPGDLGPAALEPIPTETSTLGGAVSRTFTKLYLEEGLFRIAIALIYQSPAKLTLTRKLDS